MSAIEVQNNSKTSSKSISGGESSVMEKKGEETNYNSEKSFSLRSEPLDVIDDPIEDEEEDSKQMPPPQHNSKEKDKKDKVRYSHLTQIIFLEKLVGVVIIPIL
jgi:hypothetical protein